ncbi:protein kinase domain-containing protein [Rubrobacter aplysinae]|uniref:protein kinase domain-containing protein n=1 Tax=Rubrobacter aplysinae TaxID=909625 RepID=UPI00069E0C3C|nr:protein kinase [Rubrobacter aplysinae]
MTEKTHHAVLEERYVLLERLGSGATAEVYRATDRLLGRQVALKILREEYSSESDCAQRFKDEARSAASLSHPNIVQIYELGSSQAGRPFFAMEYAGGGTLKDRLREGGALVPKDAAATAAGIARALQAAHAQGVIHRDIKPQNTLLTSTGGVKVADFGIACSPASTTEARGIHGTVRYMSPEQAKGEAVSKSSDLYSLGAVLYEMLTDTPPFCGDSQTAVALGHINEPPVAPSELNPSVPDALNDLTLRLLAKSVTERPAEAAAVAEELEARGAAIEAAAVSGSRPASGLSRVYRAGSRLFTAIPEKIVGTLLARKEPPAPNAVRLRARRVRRRRFLAAISLTALLAAAGWGLYGGDLRAMYAEADSQNSPNSGASGSTNPTTSSGEGIDSAQSTRVLVHSADTGNISANSTYLDIPVANGNPEASITITQNWNPDGDGAGGGVYNDHPVGVWYDAGRERWAIFNQDRAAMPEGASFNVVVYTDAAKTE